MFDGFQTLHNNSQQPATSNNMQQRVQMDATCNIQQCCIRLHEAKDYAGHCVFDQPSSVSNSKFVMLTVAPANFAWMSERRSTTHSINQQLYHQSL